MINKRIEEAWDSNNDANGMISTGVTYAGHPVACAAGLAALEIVEKDKLAENAKKQGEYLMQKLKPFEEKYCSVGDVRGKGLMIALELVKDKQTRQPIDIKDGLGYQLAREGRENGIMIRPYGTRLILSPPLTFNHSHCDELVFALERTFNKIDH